MKGRDRIGIVHQHEVTKDDGMCAERPAIGIRSRAFEMPEQVGCERLLPTRRADINHFGQGLSPRRCEAKRRRVVCVRRRVPRDRLFENLLEQLRQSPLFSRERADCLRIELFEPLLLLKGPHAVSIHQRTKDQPR